MSIQLNPPPAPDPPYLPLDFMKPLIADVLLLIHSLFNATILTTHLITFECMNQGSMTHSLGIAVLCSILDLLIPSWTRGWKHLHR